MDTLEVVQFQRDCAIAEALRNHLIVERILSLLPSKDLKNMRLVSPFFNIHSKKEVQKREKHVVHLANNGEMKAFLKFLKNKDLENWSPYSFKIPMGDIGRAELEKFTNFLGSRIKILDLYEGYNDKDYTKNRLDQFAIDWEDLSQDYCIFARERLTPTTPREFLDATRIMPKIWNLLESVCDSLRQLSLTLCPEVIRLSGKFPEEIPSFQRLEKLKLIYGGKLFQNYGYDEGVDEIENLDWDEIWNQDTEDKFFKNFVDKARNMKSGQIVARKNGYSRILNEIGTIRFANGGKPTLELAGKFVVRQMPYIQNLINQNYHNRITFLDLQLCSYENDWDTRSTFNDFLDFLHLIYNFILTQTESLEILKISIQDDEFMILDWINNIVFNPPPPTPAQVFQKLKLFQIQPNRGQRYKFLKGFLRGNFPVLQELFPFYDRNDSNYIEAPNVTMPAEILESTRKNYRRMMKVVKNFYP